MLRKYRSLMVQAPDSISITRVASWHSLPHPKKVPLMGEHVAISVLAPRMEEPVRSVFEVSHFSTCACDQNIRWPHRRDDLSKGPILDHARRKPDHKWAGDACAVRETARRELIKKSFNSSIPCFSSPPSELEARQEVNDVRMLASRCLRSAVLLRARN